MDLFSALDEVNFIYSYRCFVKRVTVLALLKVRPLKPKWMLNEPQRVTQKGLPYLLL